MCSTEAILKKTCRGTIKGPCDTIYGPMIKLSYIAFIFKNNHSEGYFCVIGVYMCPTEAISKKKLGV